MADGADGAGPAREDPSLEDPAPLREPPEVKGSNQEKACQLAR